MQAPLMGTIGITKGLLQCRLAMACHGNDGAEIFVGGDVRCDNFTQMLQAVSVQAFTHFYHCYTCKVMPGAIESYLVCLPGN